jgi:hypothetical protein
MRDWFPVLTLLLIAVVLATGAHLTFPVQDDGWLLMSLPESAPLHQALADRPVWGGILRTIASSAGEHRLSVALAAGLALAALMGRTTTAEGFDSRILISILPISAVLVVVLSVAGTPRSYAWVPIAAFGLMIGNSTLMTVCQHVRETRTIDSLSPVLRRYVERTQGMTVPLCPTSGFNTS